MLPLDSLADVIVKITRVAPPSRTESSVIHKCKSSTHLRNQQHKQLDWQQLLTNGKILDKLFSTHKENKVCFFTDSNWGICQAIHSFCRFSGCLFDHCLLCGSSACLPRSFPHYYYIVLYFWHLGRLFSTIYSHSFRLLVFFFTFLSSHILDLLS